MSKPCKVLKPGQLVRSIAGRDHGKYYLVYRVEGKNVLLVDGRKRTAANAKVKNVVHLQAVNLVSEEFATMAAKGNPSPEVIRATLAELLRNNPDEEAETHNV